MGLFNKWLKNKNKVSNKPQAFIEKNLGNVKVYDDLCVKINNNIYDGWVYQITSTTIYVVYTNYENKLEYVEFKKERPLDRKEVTENDITLIL